MFDFWGIYGIRVPSTIRLYAMLCIAKQVKGIMIAFYLDKIRHKGIEHTAEIYVDSWSWPSLDC